MGDYTYHMSLEVVFILAKGLFEKYFGEKDLKVTIEREKIV